MRIVSLLILLCVLHLLPGTVQAFSLSNFSYTLRRDPANLSDSQILTLLREGGFEDPERRSEELCAWVFADRRGILDAILKVHPNGLADFPLLSCAPSQEAYDFWRSKGAYRRLPESAQAVNVPAVAAYLAEGGHPDGRNGPAETSLGLALNTWRKAVEGLDPHTYHHVLVRRYNMADMKDALAQAALNGEKVVRMLFEHGASLDELTYDGIQAERGARDGVPGQTYRSLFEKQLNQSGLDRDYYDSFKTVWPLVLKAERYGKEISPLREACRKEDVAACQQVLDKADPWSPARSVADRQQKQLGQERTEWDALLAKEACKVNYEKWVYVGQACDSGLAHGKGSAVRWRTGSKFVGEFAGGRFAVGKYLRKDGTPVFEGRFNPDGSYASGRVYVDGQPVYEGDFQSGKRHGPGLCWVGGAVEECRYLEDDRIDSLHKQRVENERLRKDVDQQMRAAQARVNEEAQRQRRQREEDAAEERRDRRMAQAIGAAGAAMRGDYSAAAARAGVPGADTLHMQQQLHAREQQFLAEQRLLQQLAENNKREQTRREAEQHRTEQIALQQAQQRLQGQASAAVNAARVQSQNDSQRLAEAQLAREAEVKRLQEAQATSARREAERVKLEQERQVKQREQEQQKVDYLSAVKSGTQMKAISCYGQHYVTGDRPKVKEPAGVSSCVDVSVTAWCPGDRVGRPVTATNFVGISGCLGDTYKIEPKPACAAEEMRVIVEDVRSCR